MTTYSDAPASPISGEDIAAVDLFGSLSTDPSIILSGRNQLYMNGFRPVGIDWGKKFPYQKQWTELARRDPPWACQNVYPWQMGTGILADGLQAIDGDIDDPVLAQRLSKFVNDNFEPAPYRYRVGSPRQLWLYRAADGEPPKSYVVNRTTGYRVEVLGKGNQFFAYGIHPDSDEMLQWSRCLTTFRRDELPTLTSDHLIRLLDFAADLIEADYQSHRQPAIEDEAVPMRTSPSDRSEWAIGDIRAALRAIPNHAPDYDWWFRLACAVHDACGGSQEGKQEWMEWSQQCPEFDPSLSTKMWRSIRSADNGNRRSASSLTYEARQHEPGWNKPSRAGFTPLRISRNQ